MKVKKTPASAVSESSGDSSVESGSISQQGTVAEIAYFLAEQRGFAPGYEVDDWLQAEAGVASKHTVEA